MPLQISQRIVVNEDSLLSFLLINSMGEYENIIASSEQFFLRAYGQHRHAHSLFVIICLECLVPLELAPVAVVRGEASDV